MLISQNRKLRTVIMSIAEERIKTLNANDIQNGDYVLYWMQASQRTEYNHALEYAIVQANTLKKPLVVLFGLTNHFPEANERHYYFMLEGLAEVYHALENRGIRFVVKNQSPELAAVEMAKNADMVIVDRGYLGIQRKWRKYVAKNVACPVIQVESDVIVPLEEASFKDEFSAGTFRHKILRKLPQYLEPVKEATPVLSSLHLQFDTFSIADVKLAISRLEIDRTIRHVSFFKGGASEARKHLNRFLEFRLDQFAELRKDPTVDYGSNMSPYIHFGQISPLYIALQVIERKSASEEAFLDQLIVRRELGINYVYYNLNYDSIAGLPRWAQETLKVHENDEREYIYNPQTLENAETHDPYWNAAQKEMLFAGKMHGHMRMYWGKKILEWSETVEEALALALYLNNKYELDGRDPNSYSGVAWCFGKHDRAWEERPIFGKVRYMNAKGLQRKFDIDLYVKRMSYYE